MRIIAVFTVLLLTAGACQGQEALPSNPTLIQVGPGGYCKWSPDGRYLSFANKNGLQLYVVDSGTVRTIAPPDEIDRLNSATYEWSGPDELLFTRNRNVKIDRGSHSQWDYLSIRTDSTISVIYSESMNWGSQIRTRPKRLNTGATILARESLDCPEPLKKLRSEASLSADAYYVAEGWSTRYLGTGDRSGIWLIRTDGRPYKKISCEWLCELPLLSPNGQYVMCPVGGIVIDTAGAVVGHFGYNDDLQDWFSDNKRVLYIRLEQSESDVVASDIFISDIDATNEIQITATPDKIELDPVISPDMTMIAYRNYAPNGHFIEILDFGEVIR